MSAALARMRLDGVPIPGNRPGEAVAERRACAEPEQLFGTGRLELPARLAVRHRGVPGQLAFEACQLGDQFRELADRCLDAGAEVDRIAAVVARRREQEPVGAVVDEEKLARRGA